MIRPAAFWDEQAGGNVICRLCPAECRLSEGKTGICRCRTNQGGRLVTENYGELVTLAMDPIEKKPLYHFYPGSQILSTGPNCCNLGCLHCQNWTISQQPAPTRYVSPEELVNAAIAHRSLGVAFTYTEPMVWYEYIMDTAPLLRRAGLKVVLVSNGYINREPLEKLLGVTDALNIDLKGVRAEFYSRICKGKVAPVLDNIRLIAGTDVHLELTNLIIPTLNDSDKDLSDLVDFVASVSPLIPLHFSAYHPDHRMDIESTPESTMLRARVIAEKKLSYVYLGNVALEAGSDTLCPRCRSLLVRRNWRRVEIVGLDEARCRKCGFHTGIRV